VPTAGEDMPGFSYPNGTDTLRRPCTAIADGKKNGGSLQLKGLNVRCSGR